MLLVYSGLPQVPKALSSEIPYGFLSFSHINAPGSVAAALDLSLTSKSLQNALQSFRILVPAAPGNISILSWTSVSARGRFPGPYGPLAVLPCVSSVPPGSQCRCFCHYPTDPARIITGFPRAGVSVFPVDQQVSLNSLSGLSWFPRKSFHVYRNIPGKIFLVFRNIFLGCRKCFSRLTRKQFLLSRNNSSEIPGNLFPFFQKNHSGSRAGLFPSEPFWDLRSLSETTVPLPYLLGPRFPAAPGTTSLLLWRSVAARGRFPVPSGPGRTSCMDIGALHTLLLNSVSFPYHTAAMELLRNSLLTRQGIRNLYSGGPGQNMNVHMDTLVSTGPASPMVP